MRAQASLEFLVSFSLILLLSFLTFFIYPKLVSLQLTLDYFSEAKWIARRLANSINSAFYSGSGYVESVEIPRKLKGYDYNVIVCRSGTITLEWRNGVVSVRSAKVLGLEKECVIIAPGKVKVSNRDGEVVVS